MPERQLGSGPKTGQVGPKSRYTLSDLASLTFKVGGQVYDARKCPAPVFDAYVARFATSSGVDVSVWPIEDRRDVINAIAKKAAEKQRPFPFQFVDPAKLASKKATPILPEEAKKVAQ